LDKHQILNSDNDLRRHIDHDYWNEVVQPMVLTRNEHCLSSEVEERWEWSLVSCPKRKIWSR